MGISPAPPQNQRGLATVPPYVIMKEPDTAGIFSGKLTDWVKENWVNEKWNETL